MATQFKTKASQRTQMGKASQAYKSLIGVKSLVLIPPESSVVAFNSRESGSTDNLGSMTVSNGQTWDLTPLPTSLSLATMLAATANLALNKTYTKSEEANPSYPDTDRKKFTDGDTGSVEAAAFGYQTGTQYHLYIDVDLGSPMLIKEAKLYTGYPWGTVYAAHHVEILGSDDLITFVSLGTAGDLSAGKGTAGTQIFDVTTTPKTFRYVRFDIYRYMANAGDPGDWLMVNEGKVYCEYTGPHDFTLQFTEPSGYTFDSWETNGSVSVDDASSKNTNLHVSGTGTVTAVYVVQTFNVDIEVLVSTVASSKHMVRIDGVNYHDGDTAALVAGDHTLAWVSGNGGIFVSWGTSGDVDVDDPDSESTTLTVTNAGTIILNLIEANTQQITNPGYEDDLANWDVTNIHYDPCRGYSGTATIITDDVYAGTKALQISGTTIMRHLGILIDVNQIQAWTVWAKTGGGAGVTIVAYYDDGSNNSWTQATPDPNWTQINLLPHLTAGKRVSYFTFYSSDGGAMKFDEWSMTSVGI